MSNFKFEKTLFPEGTMFLIAPSVNKKGDRIYKLYDPNSFHAFQEKAGENWVDVSVTTSYGTVVTVDKPYAIPTLIKSKEPIWLYNRQIVNPNTGKLFTITDLSKSEPFENKEKAE